jgi:hypothetical protein
MRSAYSGCEDRPLDRRDRELPRYVAAHHGGDLRFRLARWLRSVFAVTGSSLAHFMLRLLDDKRPGTEHTGGPSLAYRSLGAHMARQ